ncbi:MAG TPA: arginine deiminase-related protein [Candidatus Saccharimonadales bacterium]|nr:arginine deiminase-related protein [Candidatus Saccharimonadales bacterium]
MPLINRTVLMSGADYFDVVDLNAYSHHVEDVDRKGAMAEFQAIQAALKQAGVNIISTPAPADCQDGIFTANWGLCRGDTVILSSLPGPRQAEEPHAEQALKDLGKKIIKAPHRFSGQGDALPCGNYLLAGSNYRTDPRMHAFVAEQLGYEVISLEAIPERDEHSQPVTNPLSGWPDSFFYDIDLAISVLRDDLIAWCPEAFTPESQEKIRALPLEKIEVSYAEATAGFACNLVSTGETVIMSAHAPELQAAIEAHGLATITPEVNELGKGGGYIRCTTLTLDNA